MPPCAAAFDSLQSKYRMSRRLKDKKRRRRASFFENCILVLVGAMAFCLAGLAHDRGIAQKWVTALFATVVPFSFVIYARRKALSRSFWGALDLPGDSRLGYMGDFRVRLGYLQPLQSFALASLHAG